MTRYQFFSLLESNLREEGGHNKHEQQIARGRNPSVDAPYSSKAKEMLGKAKYKVRGAVNKVAAPIGDAAARLRGHMSNAAQSIRDNPTLLKAQSHAAAAGKTGIQLIRRNPKASAGVAAGAVGLAGLGLAAKHLGKTPEPSNMQKIIGAAKKHPGKAALAGGAAALGGMMFLRKKPKKERK